MPEILELLRQAKSNSKKIYEPAINLIVTQYTPLIHKLIFKLGLRKNKEDYVQSGIIGILKAIETYELDKNAKFGTWVYYQIRQELQLEKVKSEQVAISRYHKKLNRKTSYELAEFLNTSYETKPEDYKQLQVDDYLAILNSLNLKLDKIEADIFTRYFILQEHIYQIKKIYPKTDISEIINKILETIRRNVKL